MSRKVRVYVDGFNLYHALLNLSNPRLRWLDLYALAEIFTHQTEDKISDILYCSAYAWHLGEEKVQRHKDYVSALQSRGVTFIEGKFKRKHLTCPLTGCERREIQKHEEKETDVNISIHMVRDALCNEADKYVLITNDTDIIPAIRMIKAERPKTYISVLTPPTYYPHKELWQITGQRGPRRILREHIERALLPDEITLADGKILRKPTKYS